MTTRLFISAPLGNGRTLTVSGDQARYLGRVLRLAPGDRLSVFNGEHGEWLAEVTSLSKRGVEISLLDAIAVDTESTLKLHLVQGISRGERMDFVVQKSTELGVKRITPVFSAHGVVKLEKKRAERRLEHWQNVANSACEQSGRIRPPLIDMPVPLNQWLGESAGRDSTQLVLVPGARTPLAAAGPPADKLCLLVGPEGGFSDKEIEDAAVAGFQAVSLGPRILRTETAALAVTAIAQSFWGDLQR